MAIGYSRVPPSSSPSSLTTRTIASVSAAPARRDRLNNFDETNRTGQHEHITLMVSKLLSGNLTRPNFKSQFQLYKHSTLNCDKNFIGLMDSSGFLQSIGGLMQKIMRKQGFNPILIILLLPNFINMCIILPVSLTRYLRHIN